MKKTAFTLLEIIIVIIIIGVLTSLALPRLFAMVERARLAEAFSTIATIRAAMERCYLINNGSYSGCNSKLDIDPGLAAGSHFTYDISPHSDISYTVEAERTDLNNGDPNQKIAMGFGVEISYRGSSLFLGMGGSSNKIYWAATEDYKNSIPNN